MSGGERAEGDGTTGKGTRGERSEVTGGARSEGTGAADELPRAGALTLREAQGEVDAWIGQFKEGYWPPLANLARLVEEVGELAREINHRHGPKRKRAEEGEADLALEMGDVLFVLCALANEQGVDLEAGLRGVLEKYGARDAERWERR